MLCHGLAMPGHFNWDVAVVAEGRTHPTKTALGGAPGSLEDALDALASDHQFLLKGDVFTEALLDTYIKYKREKEVDAVRLRPHPYEFALYYDI